MISAFSQHPHYDTFSSDKKNRTSRENHCRQSSFRCSPFRRISKLFVKAINNGKFRKSTSQYILTLQETPTESSELNKNPPHHYLAGTKNGSVIQSTIINLVPATSTLASRVISLSSDSPAMNSKIASTSRGGSNQSTSQSFIDAYLARRKREEIQKLMEMVVEWIDTRTSTTHASGAGSSSQPAASNRSSSSASSTPQKLAGQKRSLRRDSFDGSDPGRDGNEEDKRGNKRSRTGALPSPKLACPFFKREPGKYKDRQACTGPGYSSISRLKEHIYRAHKQPDNKCNRCCHIFSNADLLEEHQRADEPCKVSEDNSVDGINESQYHQLRKKPAGPKSKSIAERWAEVYCIIFPKASLIPSCYYEYDDNKRVPECCDEELDLTEYIESELIEGVRNDLEDQFDDFTENTRRNFIDIVKKRFSQIHQQLSAQRKKWQFNSAPDKAQQELSLPGDFTFPDIDFNDLFASSEFADFGTSLTDPIGGEVGYSSNLSDSAYYSMESPRSPLITS